MQLSDLPLKIDLPFAAHAGAGFIRPIPETTGVPGAASWTAGFPPQNMEPIAAGGIPPFGQDMNGVLNAITAWTRWQGSGGTVRFDATYAARIGGYPQSALLEAANNLGFWLSNIDNNSSNPDTSPDGSWSFIACTLTWAGNPNTHVAGQQATANNAPSLCWDRTNFAFWYCILTGSAASAQWVPVTNLMPVMLNVVGPTRSYSAVDTGQTFIRSNGSVRGGPAMNDTLPATGTVVNGWNVTVINADGQQPVIVSAPAGQTIQGHLAPVTLLPGQNVTITADALGNFWQTVPPVPVAFSGQAIYVNASGTWGPGVYDIDTSAGPITFTLESGGAIGDNYRINDIAGWFSTNRCTVDGNGRTIEGDPLMPLDVNWSYTILSFRTGEWKAV